MRQGSSHERMGIGRTRDAEDPRLGSMPGLTLDVMNGIDGQVCEFDAFDKERVQRTFGKRGISL